MMNITTQEIYTFKLLTGEELVARVITNNDDHLLIEHPILTMLSQQGLQMVPGLFSANLDHAVRLMHASIALVGETRDDVKNSWIQATTGIEPVTKKILTG
jgi:hypothetical protein